MSEQARSKLKSDENVFLVETNDHDANARRDHLVQIRYLYVASDWLAEHLADPKLKVIEVDLDVDDVYAQGHIPGAHLISWNKDLSGKQGTDILNRQDFERLMSSIGVSHDTVIVIYSGSDELLAIFAFWIFQYYGHEDVKILRNGATSWINSGKVLTTVVPNRTTRSEYHSRRENSAIKPDYSRLSHRLGHLNDNAEAWSSVELSYVE